MSPSILPGLWTLASDGTTLSAAQAGVTEILRRRAHPEHRNLHRVHGGPRVRRRAALRPRQHGDDPARRHAVVRGTRHRHPRQRRRHHRAIRVRTQRSVVVPGEPRLPAKLEPARWRNDGHAQPPRARTRARRHPSHERASPRRNVAIRRRRRRAVRPRGHRTRRPPPAGRTARRDVRRGHPQGAALAPGLRRLVRPLDRARAHVSLPRTGEPSGDHADRRPAPAGGGEPAHGAPGPRPTRRGIALRNQRRRHARRAHRRRACRRDGAGVRRARGDDPSRDQPGRGHLHYRRRVGAAANRRGRRRRPVRARASRRRFTPPTPPRCTAAASCWWSATRTVPPLVPAPCSTSPTPPARSGRRCAPSSWKTRPACLPAPRPHASARRNTSARRTWPRGWASPDPGSVDARRAVRRPWAHRRAPHGSADAWAQGSKLIQAARRDVPPSARVPLRTNHHLPPMLSPEPSTRLLAATPSTAHGIPPLVWLVLALNVAVVVFFIYRIVGLLRERNDAPSSAAAAPPGLGALTRLPRACALIGPAAGRRVRDDSPRSRRPCL